MTTRFPNPFEEHLPPPSPAHESLRANCSCARADHSAATPVWSSAPAPRPPEPTFRNCVSYFFRPDPCRWRRTRCRNCFQPMASMLRRSFLPKPGAARGTTRKARRPLEHLGRDKWVKSSKTPYVRGTMTISRTNPTRRTHTKFKDTCKNTNFD